MKAMGFIRGLLLAFGLLPGFVQASDADAFVAASRTVQAQLLEQWAATPDPQRLPLLTALSREALLTDSTKQAFTREGTQVVPLGTASSPTGTVKPLRLTNRLRILVAGALATHQLISDSVTQRLAATRTLQRDAQPSMLPFIQQRLAQETDAEVKSRLTRVLANLQLASPSAEIRRQAIILLGDSSDPEMQARLQPFTDKAHEPDASVRAVASDSLARIQQRMAIGDLLGQAFMGLSLGSVLLLAALGLAITYGLLGVINMAHGEMLMLGAYCTWMVQQAMAQFVPQWLAFYPLVALPVAFMFTAGAGMILERGVIRHLYGRPLETLLATWGISLMLIQLVRMTFGAQNLEVANPAWLNKTRLGMRVRAVTQNRSMAACCGVPTGRVDMLAFGLGSGIAGLGGVALSQLGNVGPELGQGYIIDSFLVVVLGGVGQLAGSVAAAFGLGVFNKILEPQMGAVLGKIVILVLIILFIQKRPQGLFALKGRVTE